MNLLGLIQAATFASLLITNAFAQTTAKPAPSPAARARTLFAEGSKLIDGGDYQTASEKINAGLKLDPKSAVGHFYSAEIEQKWGHMSTAEAEYKMSLKLDPNSKVADQAATTLGEIHSASATVSQSPTPVPASAPLPTFEEAAGFVSSKLGRCTEGSPNTTLQRASRGAAFSAANWSLETDEVMYYSVTGITDSETLTYSVRPSQLELDVQINTDPAECGFGGAEITIACSTADCVATSSNRADRQNSPPRSKLSLFFSSRDDAQRSIPALKRMLELSGARKSAY